jgi:hypothetical protein
VGALRYCQRTGRNCCAAAVGILRQRQRAGPVLDDRPGALDEVTQVDVDGLIERHAARDTDVAGQSPARLKGQRVGAAREGDGIALAEAPPLCCTASVRNWHKV